MGQIVGRMPSTWADLLEEKDRVLYWSGEVLSKVTDNVNQEQSFQIDYDNENIDRKIDAWLEANRTGIDKILQECSDVPEEFKDLLFTGIATITEECRIKMRNDYRRGYKDMKRFTRKVDKLGRKQRKIHCKLQELEDACAGEVKKFRKRLGPLRLETFKNLRTGEKLMILDKRLKTEFVKRVYDIDHKNAERCAENINKLAKRFERAALK